MVGDHRWCFCSLKSTPLKSYYRYPKWPDLKGITFSKPSDCVSMLVFGGVVFFLIRWEFDEFDDTVHLDPEMDPKGNNPHQHFHFLARFIDFLKCSEAKTSCPSKLPDFWFVTWEDTYFQTYTKPKHWRLDILFFWGGLYRPKVSWWFFRFVVYSPIGITPVEVYYMGIHGDMPLNP